MKHVFKRFGGATCITLAFLRSVVFASWVLAVHAAVLSMDPAALPAQHVNPSDGTNQLLAYIRPAHHQGDAWREHTPCAVRRLLFIRGGSSEAESHDSNSAGVNGGSGEARIICTWCFPTSSFLSSIPHPRLFFFLSSSSDLLPSFSHPHHISPSQPSPRPLPQQTYTVREGQSTFLPRIAA